MRYLQINLVQAPPAVVLTLSGEINALSYNDLREAYLQASTFGQPGLVLDFSAVEYLNSAGLAGIIQLAARAGSHGVMLIASGLTPHYRQIFEAMKLTDFISLANDVESARALISADHEQKSSPSVPVG